MSRAKEAKGGLESERIVKVTWALLILQPFRHFTYVTANSTTLPSLYLRHSSFSNPSVASSTSQLILQPFFRFSYVTGSSLTWPGEPLMCAGTGFHLLPCLHYYPTYNTLSLQKQLPIQSLWPHFFKYTNTYTLTHLTWYAQEVRESKIDHINAPNR